MRSLLRFNTLFRLFQHPFENLHDGSAALVLGIGENCGDEFSHHVRLHPQSIKHLGDTGRFSQFNNEIPFVKPILLGYLANLMKSTQAGVIGTGYISGCISKRKPRLSN